MKVRDECQMERRRKAIDAKTEEMLKMRMVDGP